MLRFCRSSQDPNTHRLHRLLQPRGGSSANCMFLFNWVTRSHSQKYVDHMWFKKSTWLVAGYPSQCDGEGIYTHQAAGEKMPALLVASKMKSGLPKPKPVHSALPIPQNPSRPSALALPPTPLKTHIPLLDQQVGSGTLRSNAPGLETRRNAQVRILNSHLHLHLLRFFFNGLPTKSIQLFVFFPLLGYVS